MSDLSEAEEQLWVSIATQIAGVGMLSERLAANDRPVLFDQDAGKGPSWWDRSVGSVIERLGANPWTWRALIGVFGAVCVIVPVVAR